VDAKLNELNVDLTAPIFKTADDTVTICGENLTINEVVRVARYNAKAKLIDAPDIIKRLEASHDYIVEAAKMGKSMPSSLTRTSTARVSVRPTSRVNPSTPFTNTWRLPLCSAHKPWICVPIRQRVIMMPAPLYPKPH
jgi:hypothetical protein